LLDVRGAVDVLPALPLSGQPGVQEAAATGTEEAPPAKAFGKLSVTSDSGAWFKTAPFQVTAQTFHGPVRPDW
jgi:hypothetical protein